MTAPDGWPNGEADLVLHRLAAAMHGADERVLLGALHELAREVGVEPLLTLAGRFLARPLPRIETVYRPGPREVRIAGDLHGGVPGTGLTVAAHAPAPRAAPSAPPADPDASDAVRAAGALPRSGLA